MIADTGRELQLQVSATCMFAAIKNRFGNANTYKQMETQICKCKHRFATAVVNIAEATQLTFAAARTGSRFAATKLTLEA